MGVRRSPVRTLAALRPSLSTGADRIWHDLKIDPITAEQHRGRYWPEPLSMLPAGAHGSAEHGVIHGTLHPLLGLDHLLMLVAVGLCAPRRGPSPGLRPGGALIGSLSAARRSTARSRSAGSPGGFRRGRRFGSGAARSVRPSDPEPHRGRRCCVHACPCLESSGSSFWWAGALLGSIAVVSASAWLSQRLERRGASLGAALLALAGGLLALAPL